MSWQSEKRSAYMEKLRDPRWQRKRLEILNRDDWACQICFNKDDTLHVHHRYYERGREPWDYPDDALVTLCECCHQSETEQRPIEEKLLLDTLRKLFFSSELVEIARMFAYMPMTHPPDVVVSAMEWNFRDADRVREFVVGYLKDLHERKAAMLKKLEGDGSTQGGATA